MIFKSSYIVTENNGVLRCEPIVGTRQFITLALATVASIAAGVAVFSMLASNISAQNRVVWSMGPSAARTAAIVPRGPIVMTTAREVPSAVETANQSGMAPRI